MLLVLWLDSLRSTKDCFKFKSFYWTNFESIAWQVYTCSILHFLTSEEFYPFDTVSSSKKSWNTCLGYIKGDNGRIFAICSILFLLIWFEHIHMTYNHAELKQCNKF